MSTQSFACVLAIASTQAVAAQWTTSAGVAPAITYTDNVCLSADDENGEWIGLLTPDFALRGEGAAANVDIAAALEMNTLSDSKLQDLGCSPQGFGNRKQIAPRLRANADAVLLENWAYIDADARIEQNEVSAFAPGGGDSLNRTGNTNTSYRYRVSPYISRRLEDIAVLDLRYVWDQQFNSENLVSDSDRHLLKFELGSVPGGPALSWGVLASYDKIKFSETRNRTSRDNELKSIQFDLGYQINRAWQVNGYVGEERNDFISVGDEIDGNFWDVGLRWTPNARTTMDLGTGERFFGDTPRFSISHRKKRSVLKASYAKVITYDRDIRSGDFDEDVLPGDALDSSTISNSPILDERFTLNYDYQGRRSILSVNASHSDQTRAQDGRDATFKRFYVSLNRTLSRRLDISAGLSWSEQNPRGERSDQIFSSETWRFAVAGQRKLNQNLDLNLQYQYTERESDRPENQYCENRVTATLRFNF